MSQDYGDPWTYKPVEQWQFQHEIPCIKRCQASIVFTLKEMQEATCSFSDDNLVGKGGFGRVYRGTLRSGEVVAIKKMELPACKVAEGEREFRVEIDILSRLYHPNLVSLIGYCADGKHRFLVYEYMHKGNLQDHLINGTGEKRMDWPVRIKVALGVAKGLAYLHSGIAAGIPIIHRDFKSSNILLGANFEAKISDFAFAKLMPEGQETHVTAKMLGTFGYLILNTHWQPYHAYDCRGTLSPYQKIFLYFLVNEKTRDVNFNFSKQSSTERTSLIIFSHPVNVSLEESSKHYVIIWQQTGKFTLQCDVYSFGVVLLELLTGRRVVEMKQGSTDQYLVLQVCNILNDRKKLQKVVDLELNRNSCTAESIALFVNLASRCVRAKSSERPSMMECVKELHLIYYTNSRGLGMSALRMFYQFKIKMLTYL